MLCKLSIKNIALIDDAEIDFDQGLNILSGETGAGKSMVIDSMNLALGVRADKDIISTGQNEAVVEAVFDISGLTEVKQLLEDAGIDDEDNLVLSRRLTRSGRNTCRVNGFITPLTELRTITRKLIDILGQHEHYSLLDESTHLEMLDAFAPEEILPQREKVFQCYREYRDLKHRMEKLFGTEAERARRIDILDFQIREIESVDPKAGEDNELQKEIELLRHAADVRDALEKTAQSLEGGLGDSALERCENAVTLLSKITRYGSQYDTLRNRLEQVSYELEDIQRELYAIRREDEYSENDLDHLESRFDTLRRLKRKYGGDIEQVLKTLDEMRNEYDELIRFDENQKELEKQLKQKGSALLTECGKLTCSRKAAAVRFEAAILDQLKDLGMEHARFNIAFDDKPDADADQVTSKGLDYVRFMISPNPGQPLQPLVKIASGGEMSRIMLALKNISAQADAIPTLIFDEIDTGISGKMARVVGEKLAEISRTHQVICVTHTPQIAAMGDQHFYISKTMTDSNTRTSVQKLNEENRVQEIERLVAGDMSALGREHALSILKYSQEYRQRMARK